MIEVCKKVFLKDNSILLGKIIEESDDKIHFKTKKKDYLFNKSEIIKIVETNEVYEEE